MTAAPPKLDGHPAVAACARVRAIDRVPTRVATLHERRWSVVYRLDRAAGDGGALVAKRIRRPLAHNEHTMYSRVLPRLPLRTLRCHGLTEDADPDLAWLVLEHCNGRPLHPGDPADRRLAGEWFAVMHVEGPRAVAGLPLPDRSATAYLELLRSARGSLRSRLGDPRAAGYGELLPELVRRCDILEARWPRIEESCGRLPATLVHGDAKPANLLTRARRPGRELVALDWAEAGWGTPAVDLSEVDVETYRSVRSRHASPELTVAELRSLARIGRAFRVLVVLSKVAPALGERDYVDRALRHLAWCVDGLDGVAGRP